MLLFNGIVYFVYHLISDSIGDIYQCSYLAQWSKSFRDVIRLCLQKDPKCRPSCDDLLSHEHFRHLLVDENLAACIDQTKKKICDVVGDIGSSSGKAGAYGEGWVFLISRFIMYRYRPWQSIPSIFLIGINLYRSLLLLYSL